jgi:hypothetical protein
MKTTGKIMEKVIHKFNVNVLLMKYARSYCMLMSFDDWYMMELYYLDTCIMDMSDDQLFESMLWDRKELMRNSITYYDV